MPQSQPRQSPRTDPFNPLDPIAIGSILRDRLEQQEPEDFPPRRFSGAGLYALYYVGDRVPEYRPLVESYYNDHKIPVYVGKAAAETSSYGYEPDYGSDKLYQRIREHARSIGEVGASINGNLRQEDFKVRYLPLEDAWIVLGERALLRTYRPVLWNSVINGFGSNPSGEARKNPKSTWDTMHPGRRRAGELPNRQLTLDEVRARVRKGVEISLMNESEDRDNAIVELREQKPPVIWGLPKRGTRDKRLLVSDEERFLAELRRIGVNAPDYRHVSTAEIPFHDEP
ncbi:Eco29kI restriction endonuclease [Lentzea albidocapillata subsp. violacea]|uniref:Eco29kI restriction endonuclease n=1 Tax=Lentzea albidocapillata subsp. violacea TaxID=128104 RepID=A0A1G9UR73_9PSEU|nr:Eco29kI family restriction endonuclease [Lentzea albidocapillata]SDM62461.1 Eco29kI restriction endonuclease [Lentzea albidocapillata subsp. violacea]